MEGRSNRRPPYVSNMDQETILEIDEGLISKSPSAHAQGNPTGHAQNGTDPKLERQMSTTKVTSLGMGSKTASLYLSRTASMVKSSRKEDPGGRNIENGENEPPRSDSRTSELSNSSGSSSRKKLESQIQREFTFTGYDIMNDTEPVEAVSDDRKEREKRANVQSYISACRLLNITPVSYVVKHINDGTLAMKSHPLGKQGTRAMCIALVKNKRIETLDLEDNDIGPEGAVCISELLQKNLTLTEISLAENRIGTVGIQALANALSDNREIISLDVSGSNLEDDDAKYIADIIENNHHLRVFNVSHNQLGTSGGITIGRALVANDSLRDLNISWNHLRGKGAMALAVGVQRNVGLKRLNISWNGFGKDGCTQMGVALSVNRTLAELDISSNRMGTDAVGGLMKGVQVNETLRILRIGQNPFSPEVALTILRAIGESDSCFVDTLDMAEMVVDDDFVKTWLEIKKTKTIHVIFGATVKGQEVPRKDPNAIDWRDPVVRMFQYMNDQGYRVIDLLKRLDKDRSLSVDREEFKKGMMSFGGEMPQAENIPLTEAQLDEIVARLDTDGDGEVDMAELMAGEKDFRKRMHARTRRMMKQAMSADKIEAVIKAMTRIDE